MRIFIVAILLRLAILYGLSLTYPSINISYDMHMDAREYYHNAQHLTKGDAKTDWQTTYTHWWERSPLYVLFLWFFNPVAVYVQILISSFGVYLLWRMNWKAGWVWNIYECWYSIIFLKESITFALMIFIYYRIFKAENNSHLLVQPPVSNVK